MKKVLIFILFVLLLAGCERDEFAGVAVVPPSGPEFSAFAESFGVDSKSVLASDLSSAWTRGDEIAVFCNKPSAHRYMLDEDCDGMTEGVFSIVEEGEDNGTEILTNLAVYPYQEGLSCGISQFVNGKPAAYRVNGFSFPANQSYTAGSFGDDSYAMVAIASGSDDYNLNFKNLGGALKLQLTGTALITKLTLVGNSNEKISGQYYITAYTDGSAPSVSLHVSAQNSIVLDCGNGVQLNENEPTAFFFSLPPTNFKQGFTIFMESADGGSGTLTTSAANYVGRSQILSMPAVAAVIAQPLENRSYVDEWGVNRGRGIKVDGVVWAPVNCGYKGPATLDRGYPYGKLYQWGRKFGHGYSLAYDASVATKVAGGSVTVADGNADSNAIIFYTRSDGNNLSNWFSDTEYSGVWDCGTSNAPVKSEYDPCPQGWRVPTEAEMNSLVANKSPWSVVGSQNGYWFSGSTEYSGGVDAVFLPAAGWLHYTGIGQSRGSIGRYLSSTVTQSGYIKQLYISNSSSNVSSNGTVFGCSVRCVADANFVGNTEDGIIDIESIVLSEEDIVMMIGDVSSLMAEILPAEASGEFLHWSSSDEDIVGVDQSGNLYAYELGEAVITVESGDVSATCKVTVVEHYVELIDYIDEYDVNHGAGVMINGVIWAPVNCGYQASSDSDKGYPYGKVYQWGRRDGFGYSTTYDSTVPYKLAGPIEGTEDFDSYYLVAYWWWYRDEGDVYTDYSNTFIKTSGSNDDWFTMPDWDGDEYIERSFFWNWGSTEFPEKSDVDPCPEGWRLPTFDELELLSRNHSAVSVYNGQKGFWYSGSNEYSDDVEAVFLPSAGFLNYNGEPLLRTQAGRYWCSTPSPAGSISSLYFQGYTNSSGVLVEELSLAGCSTVNACSVRCVQVQECL